jgi:hypothetical protein
MDSVPSGRITPWGYKPPASNKVVGWKQRMLHEMIAYWINLLYPALFFGLFTNYRRLILARYQIVYANYWVAVIKAVVLAKVILAAESLPIGRGFEGKPLIVPTLFNSLLFTVSVALFGVVESLIRSFIKGDRTHGTR